jgi:hypothetical protein
LEKSELGAINPFPSPQKQKTSGGVIDVYPYNYIWKEVELL